MEPAPGGAAGAGIAPVVRRRVRALRGATTVDEDSGAQVSERTQALLRAMLGEAAARKIPRTQIIVDVDAVWLM